MTLAAQILDHRALARGITFTSTSEQSISRFIYSHITNPTYRNNEVPDLIIGAYHPVVWFARDYFIGPARVSNDWTQGDQL